MIRRLTRLCAMITIGAVCGLLFACQTAADHRNGTAVDWLRPHYSADTYLVTGVQPLPYTTALTATEQQVADSVRNALEFGLFAFAPDSSCDLILRNQLIMSRYRLDGRRLGTSLGTYRNVRQTGYGFTMTVPVQVDLGQIGLRCDLHRIEFGHDKQRALALAKVVFAHPTVPETDEQIRMRVKNCLAFYALYFKAIYANQLNQFKPAAVGMPIRFYNGGLRLANFEDNKPWKGLYANEENAKKAHRCFRKAIKSIKYYPERGHLILEYAVIFDQMSDFL
jgi:hypothetical protein